jgi:PPOX class probable F420-dependent enzyme
MEKMTEEECRAFLMMGTRTGKLATASGNGRPHVAPIWFVLDGRDIIFTTGADTIKAKHLRRDPRVALCVDEEQAMYSYVVVEGTASMRDDLDAMLPWATQIAGRYMGMGQAEAYGKRNAVEGELLVRITPTKFIGQKDVAS